MPLSSTTRLPRVDTHFFFSTIRLPPTSTLLSLHDALPISEVVGIDVEDGRIRRVRTDKGEIETETVVVACGVWRDRKSTRLNSSHVSISYAVFCLKKKNITVMITLAESIGSAQTHGRLTRM